MTTLQKAEARSQGRRQHGVVRFLKRALLGLKPNQRLSLTREGRVYIVVWMALLAIGLHQQSNLVLLTAGLAAGPMAASILISAGMLRRQSLERRVPTYVFSEEPLTIDYALNNGRRWMATIAQEVNDEIVPSEGALPDAARLLPTVFFRRVAAQGRERLRWESVSPRRGRYTMSHIEMVTRSPFGLWERTLTIPEPDELIVYPKVGTLSRRWFHAFRDLTETKGGRRHDRSADHLDYHGLRDYRPGDSPRWLHWRTTARVGQPMVKEFEQQHEQDIAILLDPWLPRTRITSQHRQTLETAISFVATVCLELCRGQGRRMVLGWTGPNPGILQGTGSIRLLHEFLRELAMLRGSSEGSLSTLFDSLPVQTVRQAMLVVVTTRPLNLLEEMERSRRLSGTGGRSTVNRVTLLDASRGDLTPLISFDKARGRVMGPRRDRTGISPEDNGSTAGAG